MTSCPGKFISPTESETLQSQINYSYKNKCWFEILEKFAQELDLDYELTGFPGLPTLEIFSPKIQDLELMKETLHGIFGKTIKIVKVPGEYTFFDRFKIRIKY